MRIDMEIGVYCVYYYEQSKQTHSKKQTNTSDN